MMRRQGKTPKNHHRDNLRAIKEMNAINQLQRELHEKEVEVAELKKRSAKVIKVVRSPVRVRPEGEERNFLRDPYGRRIPDRFVRLGDNKITRSRFREVHVAHRVKRHAHKKFQLLRLWLENRLNDHIRRNFVCADSIKCSGQPHHQQDRLDDN